MKLFFKKESSGDRKEKRSFPRFDLYQASYCRMDSASGEEDSSNMYDCWINNLSRGGICFDLREEDLKNNDKIVILYKIKQKLRKDKAVIRYSKKVFNNWRFGGEFYEDDSDRDTDILNFIESLKE